mmetsp:Transcript_5203/g.12413  ORF Transcript_5203/g.12413 Transcript_5203/m.12413 type:complete len:214 (+) Transcript_5203:1061-1702(+)
MLCFELFEFFLFLFQVLEAFAIIVLVPHEIIHLWQMRITVSIIVLVVVVVLDCFEHFFLLSFFSQFLLLSFPFLFVEGTLCQSQTTSHGGCLENVFCSTPSPSNSNRQIGLGLKYHLFSLIGVSALQKFTSFVAIRSAHGANDLRPERQPFPSIAILRQQMAVEPGIEPAFDKWSKGFQQEGSNCVNSMFFQDNGWIRAITMVRCVCCHCQNF